jgi:16S rRNA (cytosine967-C5)-methyltransferase
MTARDIAIEALVRVDDGAYSNLLLPTLLRGSRLEPRDRAFATDLVYSTLREQRALDHLLLPSLTRPLDRLDPDVRAALRLGAYQLRAGVAPHAAVGETVTAIGRRNPRAKGFVNAVLRSVAASGPPWVLPDGDDISSLAVRTSHPDWIVARLVDDLGPVDAAAVLESDNRAPGVTLRANPCRTDPSRLADELRATGIRVEPGALLPDALVVTGVGDLAALPSVAEGRATPQDQASQAVVVALDPRPGDRVLEIAAAPGGKASAIAERVGATGSGSGGSGSGGSVVGLDLNPGRVARIAEAAGRLGLDRLFPLVADGLALPRRPGSFDRVLLDAPCSGLGVLRRRPEARWRLDPHAPEQLAELQRELLRAAVAALRPGGVLVYSVCTLTTIETLDVDEWAAAELPGLDALAPPGPPWRPHGRGALLLPSAADSDGMFVLRLQLGETERVAGHDPRTANR